MKMKDHRNKEVATIEESSQVRSSEDVGSPTAKVLEVQEEKMASRSATTTSRVKSSAAAQDALESKKATTRTDRIISMPLKGILTPSKRDGTPRRSKSVAFDSSNAQDTEEVFFEDLPIKSATKSGGGGKPPQKLASTKTTAKNPVKPRKALAKMIEEGPTAEETESQEEEQAAAEKSDEDEDEDVCLICSKPDSKAGNQIMFCDGCDKAYHQKCYKVPKVPRGDWYCNECLDQKQSRAAAADEAVKIPNFQQHLSKLKRVLLDRCTGRRRIKLIDQDDAMKKAHQVVEQTVLSGEGNSMLIIGARGGLLSAF
ncbi:PHD-finger domain-containing protein [Colletotrichum graminicola M1.001]|uniref:PHD-finger domain-containing protein n=1 Tax=Colletotrichum graminicola (strain M1.001 / M2 / FGSC 10212) TaxID=645133 RepID=E3QA95_COLGM|nr:PHD-finger domain-containing protein [Colletotrichum graminicola M1.001]EFQ27783.1 PHD-finger domain-containing protein [Colletotrichum graminicola M1.001]